MRHKRANIISTVIIVIMTIIMGKSLLNYLQLPEVHVNQEGHCIRVIPGNTYNCENLPNKYIQFTVNK